MRPSDPRLRRALTPARRPLMGVVAAGVGGSLLLIAQAWLVAELVLAALHGTQGDVARAAARVVAVLALRGLLGWAGEWSAAAAATSVGRSLRRRLVEVAADRDRGRSGELTVLVTRGVSAAEPYLTRYLPALVLAGVLPPLTVLAIASQDWVSAVIVLLTLPLIPVFGALVGLATRDRAQEQWREMASLSGHFVDVVRGLPTLVAHRRAKAQSARIGEVTERYRVASMATLRIAFASSAVLELVATLSVALVAVTVGIRLAGGSLGLHTALVVLLLCPEAYWPLRRVGAEFHAAAEGLATFEAADAVLSAAGDETRDGGPAPVGAPLRLEAVSVTYPGRDVPALSRLTAVVPGHGVTVVTGPSGCGKTTLLTALAGLRPHEGRVTADGEQVGGPAWRAQVAWLPQRPVFVSGTIADNLRLGRPCATEDELWAALRRVALEERVRALPGELDAPVGEDGTTLSAGERARLALARVVVADRPWVLLDEPTAHLDPLTEQVIADTIVELGRTSAVVVVAHRPALIELADHVLALPAPPEPTAPGPRAVRGRRTAPPEAGAPAVTDRASSSGMALPTVLGSLASASGVALTATAGWLIVRASERPEVLTLLVAIVGVRTFGLARPVLRYAERLRSHDVALRRLAQRRVQVYDALVPLVPARLGRRRGDLLASVVDDVDSVVDHELRVRMPVRTFGLVALLAAVVSGLFAPVAGLVVAGASLLGGVAGFGLARVGASRTEEVAVAARAELSTAVLEATQVADELRMWQATGRAVDRIDEVSARLGSAARRVATWLGAARAVVLATAGAGVGVMALVLAPEARSGAVSGPVLALLVLVPLALAEVAATLPDAGVLSVRTRAAQRRLGRLAHTAPAVRDTVTRSVPSGTAVSLERARARWTPRGATTAPLSLRLQPGERVALVGPSGSGKSTAAALLMRFLDPVDGRAAIGGSDLRDLALDDVRRRVGLVDDDPHVFASTLVENVRLARPGAPDEDVERALRSAHLGPWLDALPDGLDTWLGEGHAAVSGGERARLGIARALLADVPVLVLDEPTAHLDGPTARRVAAEVLGDDDARAVLWITHADAGLDLVDRVVTLAPDPDVRTAPLGVETTS